MSVLIPRAPTGTGESNPNPVRDNQLELAASIGGNLVACVKGFLGKASFQDAANICYADSISAELDVLPDNSRHFIPSTAPSRSSGDFNCFAEWNHSLNLDIVFSFQQLRVAHLKIVVSTTTINGKQAFGECILDLSSVVSFATKPVVTILPVYVPRRHGEKRVFAEDSQLCGWIIFGCAFTANDPTEIASHVTNASHTSWGRIISDKQAVSSIGWSVNLGPETTTSVNTSQVHLAFGRVQGVAPVIDESLAAQGSVRLEAHVGGYPLPTQPIVQMSGTGGWVNSDIISTYIGNGNVSPIIHFYIISIVQNIETILGECTVLVPTSGLALGVPLNTRISLRDFSGNRLLLATVGFQTTSIGGGDSVPIPVNIHDCKVVSYVDYDSIDSPDANTRIKISIIDGSISDPNWKANIEPFFEVHIMPPMTGAHPQLPPPAISGRTRFLNFSNNKETWNIEKTLGFFVELLPKSAMEESQMVTYSVIIACRDAARFMCAEIGWAKISLPWSLLCRGRVVDQWVSFQPARVDAKHAVGSRKSAGRIRVRISKISDAGHSKIECLHEKVSLPTIVAKGDIRLAHPGIGTVVMWMHGVYEMGAGNVQEKRNISIATASASVVMVANNEENLLAEEVKQLYSEVAITIDEPINKTLARTMEGNMMDVSEEGLFCHWASLPVSSGRTTEISVSVTAEGNIVPYVTSFPVMQSINPFDSSDNAQPVIPQLQLLLTDANAVHNTRKSKKPSILSLNAAFVPFVSGSLVVATGSVSVTAFAASKFAGSSSVKRAALRYVLGNTVYGFSNEFRLDSKGVSSAATGGRSNVIAIPIDTLMETVRNEHGSSFELQVYLVDLDCTDGSYCMGVGSIQTAALYYLAMRCAASSSMPATTAEGGIDSSNQSSVSVGLSPWLQSELKLIDPIMNQVIAVASLSIQFVCDTICQPVLNLLAAATGRSLTDPEAKARTELGLKQTFVLADSDKSGNVSQMELLKVIKSSGPVRRRGARPVTTLVGMENAVELLLGLANCNSHSSHSGDITAEQLDEEVKNIFKRLDVDGDGSVSWWEWQCVLSACLNGKNPEAVFVDPGETLCIGVLAAKNAITSHNAESVRDISSIVKVIPFAPITSVEQYANNKEADMDDISLSFLRPDQAEGDVDPNAPPEKLHSMVKTLRSANTMLVSRLEKALSSTSVGNRNYHNSSSNALLLTAPAALGGGSAPATNPPYPMIATPQYTSTFDRSLSYFGINRNQTSPVNTTTMAPMTPMNASNTVIGKSDRESELEQEIARLKERIALNNQLKTDKKTSNEHIRSKLLDEVERRKAEIEEAQKQRAQKMKAMFTLILAIKRYLLPKYRKRVYNRCKLRIAAVLRTVIARHRFLKLRKKQIVAAKSIQSVIRGHKQRAQVNKIRKYVIKIQSLVRGHLARKRAKQLILTRQLMAEARANAAAIRIQKYGRRKKAMREMRSLKKFKEKVRQVSLLQMIWRAVQSKRQLDALRKEKLESERRQQLYLAAVILIQNATRKYLRRINEQRMKLFLRKQNSAIVLQRHSRGFVQRRKYRRYKHEKDMNLAALRLQSIQRGRDARRKAFDIKKSNANKMFLLESFETVEKCSRRRDRPHINDLPNKIVKLYFEAAPNIEGDEKEKDKDSDNNDSGRGSARVGTYWGRVARVDVMLRLLHVSFFDKEALTLFSQPVPYDHPQLEWYAMPDDDFNYDTVVDLVEEEEPVVVIDVSEEERRQQASVRVIQKYIRGGLTRKKVARTRATAYWTNLQKLFHDVYTTQWTRITRPTIELCQMYIICIVEPVQFLGFKYQSVTWGRVHEVNIEEAELVLELFDPNRLSIKLRVLPFNSPIIEWYKAPMLTHKYQEAEKHHSKVGKNALDALVGHNVRNDVIEAKEVEKPGIENVTDGYYVSVSVNGNIEKCGQVVSIDAQTRILRVNFYFDTREVLEDVPYDHPFLVWYKEILSTAARPHPFRPKITRSVGFEIALTDTDGHIIDRGKICDFNVLDNTITVRYYVRERFSEKIVTKNNASIVNARKSIVTETYDFDSERIIWIHSMRFESKICRPPILLARGFVVHVKAETLIEFRTDYYSGIVHGVNKQDNSITIRYEQDLSNRAAASTSGRRTSSKQLTASLQDAVVEPIDFDSPDIAWMGYPNVAFGRSRVPRPPIEDSVGYLVEVSSLLPDAVEGDYFMGMVTDFNISKQQVIIRFMSTGEDADEEAYRYDSMDIAWMRQPTPWLESKVAKPKLKYAVGYGVAIKRNDLFNLETFANNEDKAADNEQSDYLEGVVQFIDQKANTVTVLIQSDTNGIPTTRTMHYDSKDIAWMALPVIKVRSRCSRPEFGDALGYIVDVKLEQLANKMGGTSPSLSPGKSGKSTFTPMRKQTSTGNFAANSTDDDDSLYTRGVVVKLKGHNDMRLLGIRFATPIEPGGSADAIKYYSYGSDSIAWMAPPKKPVEMSLVSRPRRINDCIGYVVEIPSTLPDAEFGDFFRGEIVSVDSEKHIVRIEFDHRTAALESGHGGHNSSHGHQGHADHGVENEDYADCNFYSDQIMWVSTVNTRKRSRVTRPVLISDAIGYVVCIKTVREPENILNIPDSLDPVSEAAEEHEDSAGQKENFSPRNNEEQILLSPRAVSAKNGAALVDEFNLVMYQTGTVVRVDKREKIIMVRITNEEHINTNLDYTTAPFLSEEVVWLDEPKPFQTRSIISRPRHVNEVIGCTVAIPALIPNEELGYEYGDYFVAVVSSVSIDDAHEDNDGNHDASELAMVHFRYDNKKRSIFKSRAGGDPGCPTSPISMSQTLNQTMAALVSSMDDSPSNEQSRQLVRESHLDVINQGQPSQLPFKSSHIAWLSKAPIPTQLSVVERPATVYDATGYAVQIKSKLPDSQDGDFFSGTVAYTDQKASGVYVCFESNDSNNIHADLDLEKYSFDSSDICWMAEPPTIENSAGCKIGIRHLVDFASHRYAYLEVGYVVGSIQSTQQIVCILYSEGKALVRTFVLGKRILPFDWLSVYQKKMVLKPINRPSVSDVVGCVVEIPGDENDETAEELSPRSLCEPLKALVIGLSSDGNKMLRVRFFVDDEFDDEEDTIPFASTLKCYAFAAE